MKIIKWLDNNLENYLTLLFYLYLVLIVFVEVIRRYALGGSSMWGEETARYAFVWMTYIAAARGVKTRSHLRIDTLITNAGRKVKLTADILSDVCFFILAVIIVYYSILPVLSNIEYGVSMTGSSLPMALATIAVPIAWTLIAVRVVQRFLKTIKNSRSQGNI